VGGCVVDTVDRYQAVVNCTINGVKREPDIREFS
jgi:hypothetical protein